MVESGTIFDAVNYISEELNIELCRVYADDNDRVVVGRLQEADGTVSANTINKTVVTLVNTEQITVQGRAPVSVSIGDQASIGRSSPLHLNLYLLVASGYTDYTEALKNISLCAAFFQSRKDISSGSGVVLPGTIEKLDVQLESLTIGELSNLWGMHGGRHYPSLYYRVRMITLDRGSVLQQTAAIREPAVGVGS